MGGKGLKLIQVMVCVGGGHTAGAALGSLHGGWEGHTAGAAWAHCMTGWGEAHRMWDGGGGGAYYMRG